MSRRQEAVEHIVIRVVRVRNRKQGEIPGHAVEGVQDEIGGNFNDGRVVDGPNEELKRRVQSRSVDCAIAQ